MIFFLRMIARSLSRQIARRLLIALTLCLSTTVCVAMLAVAFDVGDKLNAELTNYGSNIVVQPKSAAIVSNLYGASSPSNNRDAAELLSERDMPKIKTIFWAYNITNFAPKLTVQGSVSSSSGAVDDISVVGTWFHKYLEIDTGETTVVGVQTMRSWWSVEGQWAGDCEDIDSCNPQAMIGSGLAQQLNVSVGDTISIAPITLTVSAIFTSGDEEDSAIYVPSIVAQSIAGLDDCIDEVEVRALTTPENDLARKAAKNPAALSIEEWETWYCTAYASSIAYQIEEVLPGSVAKQVRQVAAVQGEVLTKTQLIMVIMTVVSLVAAAIAVANLMASSINERSAELALLKAVGASNASIARLVLAETSVIALLGALVGAGVGSLVAQFIGYLVFDACVIMRPMVFVLMAVLLAVTVLLASLSAMRSVFALRPAEVLHGR